jgi:hypothetical protein
MLSVLVSIVVVLLIVGVALWVLQQLPWISGDIKQVIRVIIIAVVAIYVIMVLASLFGGTSPFIYPRR